MHLPGEPPIVSELMAWCLDRTEATATREVRVPLLFDAFRDLIDPDMPMITVAGTSGKGSVCAMLEAVLTADGHTVGLYSKPHLIEFRERFRVAGRTVSSSDFVAVSEVILSRVRAFVALHGIAVKPLPYEVLILIALSLFRRYGVTVAIFEAGVGGSNCATSYLPSLVSVLTSVDLDHEQEIGPTLEAIARNKAGIAPRNGTLIIGASVSDEIRPTVLGESFARRVRCLTTGDLTVRVESQSIRGQTLRVRTGQDETSFSIPFPGRHQALNAVTVFRAFCFLREIGLIRDCHAIDGISHASIPGRMEWIPGSANSPDWLLDVAHNPASIRSLIQTLSETVDSSRIVCLVGTSERHDARQMVTLLRNDHFPLGFCGGFPRAIDPAQLREVAGPGQDDLESFTSPAEAVRICESMTRLRDAIVLVTGSLFLVGAVRRELIGLGRIQAEAGPS